MAGSSGSSRSALETGPKHLCVICGSDQNRTPTDFALTDAGNAELFAYLYGDQLRYDYRRHRWFWDEHHWSKTVMPPLCSELSTQSGNSSSMARLGVHSPIG